MYQMSSHIALYLRDEMFTLKHFHVLKVVSDGIQDTMHVTMTGAY